MGSVLSRGRSVSLLNEFLWLYLAGQRLETEVKGQGLCMLAALMGHFLIFWLESLYVKKSKLLSIEKLPLLLLLRVSGLRRLQREHSVRF